MPTDRRPPDTEAIRAALDRQYPPLAARQEALTALGRLVARLEAAERIVRAARDFLDCDEGTDIQFLSEDGIDFYNALEAALAAAAPGETGKTS